MPVIVDEVVISVHIPNEDAAGNAGAASALDRQALVAECVERVLEILREREKR
ncbi:MAG: DUF5908 family protein [Phycisphaerales bacterium]